MAANVKASLVGRDKELQQIETSIRLGRNLLVEGPVGVGKTYLVLRALEKLKRQFERVDGDTRYSEQKLTGWFDPPLVLKKGYRADTFISGPLVDAMEKGKVLFVNELNRMPEAVQNILLPAMDERRIVLPKLGSIEAKPGFLVIATQNPAEFTATHALSEALLDRFEMIHLEYQTQEEELEILQSQLGKTFDPVAANAIVELVRKTRGHSAVKRGASLRAALAIGDLVKSNISFKEACYLALPSRIELVSGEDDVYRFIDDLIAGVAAPAQKKKSL